MSTMSIVDVESNLAAATTAPATGGARVQLDWLVQLRWVAVVGQLLTVLAASRIYGIDLPSQALLGAIAVTALTNLGLQLASRRSDRSNARMRESGEGLALTVLVFDLGILTFQIYWTGGLTNPFALFYFVNLVVCGIILSTQRTWFLFVLSAACFVMLALDFVPIAELQNPRNLHSIFHNGFPTQAQQGLLVSFCLCAGVIVHFVTKLTGAVREQEHQLRNAELKRALAQRWEALGTLAAGAAHELATPLSTIAVAASELERQCGQQGQTSCVSEEFREIRHALTRCRAILDRMALDAGRTTLEENTPISAADLVEAMRDSFAQNDRRLTVVAAAEPSATIRGPRESLNQALRSFVQNALDATSPEGPAVEVSIRSTPEHLLFVVVDRGIGMSREVLEHADEPFFTTKEAGQGMGMGRFIARQVIRQFGGEVHTESTPGAGTTVCVRLPLDTKDPFCE